MSATAELIEQIRAVLQSPVAVGQERAFELASAYARACGAANDRAGQCRDLLNQSRREDALRILRAEPDLRQEVQLLAFPECETWMAYCEAAGIKLRQYALKSYLIHQVLKDLSEESGALDRLLRVHRRLALGMAPLASRLYILRQIARADPQRPFWQDDVRTFEVAYLVDIERAGRHAVARNDGKTLKSILADLGSKDWFSPPPPDVVRRVRELAGPIILREADARYKELADQLRAARSARDENGCNQLLQQLHAEIEQYGVDPSPDVQDEITSTRAWLDDLDRMAREEFAYEQACAALANALDEDSKLPPLKQIEQFERLEAAAHAFGRGLPQALAERLAARKGALRSAVRRRFVLTWTSIVGALLLLAAAAAGAFFWWRQAAELRSWEERIREPIEAQKFDAAGDLLRKLEETRPRVFNHPRIQKLRADYIDLYSAELAQRVDSAIRDGDHGRAGALLSWMDKGQPDLAAAPKIQAARDRLRQAIEQERGRRNELEGVLADIEKRGAADPGLPALLGRAEELARTDEEKARVTRSRQDRASHVQGQFDKEFQGLEKKRDAVRIKGQALLDDPKALGDANAVSSWKIEASQCVELATALGNRNKEVKDEGPRAAKAIIRDTLDLMGKVQQELDKRAGIVDALHRIAGLYNQPAALAEALAAFEKKYPNDPRAEQFNKAAHLVKSWEAAVAWREMVAPWQGQWRVDSDRTAAERLSAVKKHLADYLRETPYANPGKDYQDYLTVAKDALENAPILTGKKIVDFLRGFAFGERVRVLRKKDGTVYYLARPDSLKIAQAGGKAAYTFKYFKDLLGTEVVVKDVVWADDVVGGSLQEAPQIGLAASLLERLQAFKVEAWPTFYLDVAEVARAHKAADPIPRAILVTTALDLAAQCAPARAAADINAQLKKLEALQPKVNWLDPDNTDAAQRRPLVGAALEGMDLARLKKAIEQALAAMEEPLAPVRLVGLLLDAKGEPRLGEGVSAGDLCVIVQDGAGGVAFRKIGAAVDGKAVVQSSVVAGLYLGTPVFLKSPK